MDPYRLLSRSTKLIKAREKRRSQNDPPSAQPPSPQLFSESNGDPYLSRKRKRGEDGLDISANSSDELSFFQSLETASKSGAHRQTSASPDSSRKAGGDGRHIEDVKLSNGIELSLEQRKQILMKHKVKVTWINPPESQKSEKRKLPGSKERNSKKALFPKPLQSFHGLRGDYGISRTLADNVAEQGFTTPTEVQLSSIPLLLGNATEHILESEIRMPASLTTMDLLTVAPTGSGKTLAFMIPLVHHLIQQQKTDPRGHQTCAIILAPTKELVGQIVNEGRKLSKGTGLKVSQMRKGMHFASVRTHQDPEEHAKLGPDTSVVKSEIIVSTPGVLHSSLTHNHNALSKVQTLVLDEADVLLDPLFRAQTLDIWNSLSNPTLRVSMWSATMGSNIEELVRSTIHSRLQLLSARNDIQIDEAPLIRVVVGLKDSAVSNVDHKLIYAATEQGKLMALRQLLHPTASSTESGPPLRPPFLIFTQTIERAVALHSELLYDIPPEAGGIARIAVLHSDLSDSARDDVMTRFRKGEIWVLITTDLLSRGVDFRGINGVVNYDIPTSSAAYVHRVGRTGRAGRDGGVAVTLYSKEDVPYLKNVANVAKMARKEDGENEGVQQWLLDSLPSLSKNEKQKLKKRGVESRTAKGKQANPKAARRSRISTKAGFLRQTENKRKGAVLGSQRRSFLDIDKNSDHESEFGGFD